ncbi:flagellar biosynthetic protein FliR [Buchnera aphidicola (Hyadaphis tataricae)]|uniref:Flagellar biosynthetic protein FliR n=1 Tax=Buchnera aphidicola (Hyadaphis tataricae) TaxID=1241859 RepID=A0A4D6YAL9_9GAMM|nr:flagellar biosynthetic protein FliR [Buchnera aphidicola]QCI21405.1 flagellar biosynthetic protein FliR [Buchnera aphidicola (Hyadaphis tataricae)]
MFTLNSFQLLTLISSIFWPMVRILSFFSIAPVFNDKLINKKIKIGLAVIISFLISPVLPEVHTVLFSYFGILLLFQQILIGFVLGFTAQLLFAVVNFSGEIIGLQMGLSFANFFNSNSHIGASIISRLLNIIFFLFFLSLNVHLYLIAILVDSFYSMPIDYYFLNSSIFLILLKFSSHIFLSGLLLIFPVIITLLTVSCVMSIANRFAPQISIFSIGFPLNLLAGIFALYYLSSIVFPFFENSLHELMYFISQTFLKT